jgi:non-canonical (house-cleaning) NTP pyrophosphatase
VLKPGTFQALRSTAVQGPHPGHVGEQVEKVAVHERARHHAVQLAQVQHGVGVEAHLSERHAVGLFHFLAKFW